jgi:hypothetical protein
MSFLGNLVINFLVAFGMVVGGSILGGIGAMLTPHKQPMLMMITLSDRLKIWAMVSALGGSMDTLKLIGEGVLTRQLDPVGRQLTYLIVAFIGCQTGALLVNWFATGAQK